MHRPSSARVRVLVAALGLVTGAACSESRPPARADSAARSTGPVVSVPAAPVVAPRAPLQGEPAPDTAGSGTPAADGGTTKVAPRVVSPRRIVFGYVDFTGVGHDRGSPTAPVVMIDLSDFACPYCGEFSRDVYPAIDREYVRTGKVLFKYIPFIAGSFPHAAEATRAAECAAEQGQFWTMLDRLYATQAEWKRGRAADAQMAALAGTLPVDMAKFAACYADRHTDARTARATGIANEIGVRVTPSFLVDGNPVQGALPLAEFRKQIETALLLKAAERRPAGRGSP
jgi:protein-disulfide isomerase